MGTKKSGEKRPSRKTSKKYPWEKFTQKQVIAAIKGTGGIKMEIAGRLECSRTTLDRYIDTYPKVADAYQEEVESVKDMAEASLFKNIQNHDMTAIMYYLNNKGQDRGYNKPKDEAKDPQRPFTLSLNFGPKPDQTDRRAPQPGGEGSDGQ